MENYVIKSYEEGFEEDQARIGTEVAKSYPLPHQTSAEGLKNNYTREGFDPESRLYAFNEDKMIGFLTSNVLPVGEDGIKRASVTPPQVLKEHDAVSELLFNKAIEVLKAKGVKKVQSWFGCTQNKSEEDAKKWGYKSLNTNQYLYSIKLDEIDTSISTNDIIDFDFEKHKKGVASIIAKEYERDDEWALNLLERIHNQVNNTFTKRMVFEEDGEIKALAFFGANPINPKIARALVVQASDKKYMKPMLAKVAKISKEQAIESLIIVFTEESDIKQDKYKPIQFELIGSTVQYEKDL
ncbi:MAG: hypothetical protein ACTSQK_05405 [Candidatus Heimdallarchaeota archaeon]